MGLSELEKSNDLAGLIKAVRDEVAIDRRAFTRADIKAWCRRRWRFLFVEEAISDAVALDVATSWGDKRSPRQRIAERFLHDGASCWTDEQPEFHHQDIGATTLLFCPGMLNGLLPVRAFRDDLPKIETRFSMPVLRADANPLGSCKANVADIQRAFDGGEGLDAAGHLLLGGAQRPPGDVMAISYSKGGPDFITALAQQPELAKRVRCAFFWSSPLLGTAAADSARKQFKSVKLLANNAGAISKAVKGFVPSAFKTDGRALRRVDEYDARACTQDLCTDVREQFMTEQSGTLDGFNIPLFTIGAATQKSEVPLVQRGGFKQLCRQDPNNDMQVPCNRAVLPIDMAIDLGIVHGHHWDIAYPAFVKRKWFNNMYHGFPKTAAVVAMVQLAAELGLID